MEVVPIHIPLPKLAGSYDLFTVDTALRFHHPGLVGATKIEWIDCACYNVSCPDFAYPLPEGTSWVKAIKGLKWLHQTGRALGKLDETILFASHGDDGKIYAQLFIGDSISVATEENKATNMASLNSYISGGNSYMSGGNSYINDVNTEVVAEDEGQIDMNYDHVLTEENVLSHPGRDSMKKVIDILTKELTKWNVEEFLLIVDIVQRLFLVCDVQIVTLVNIARNCVSQLRGEIVDEASVPPQQHLLLRYLLVNFGGVYYSPLQEKMQTKKDFLRVINYYMLNFDKTTYFLAERDAVRKEGCRKILQITLSEALSNL